MLPETKRIMILRFIQPFRALEPYCEIKSREVQTAMILFDIMNNDMLRTTLNAFLSEE